MKQCDALTSTKFCPNDFAGEYRGPDTIRFDGQFEYTTVGNISWGHECDNLRLDECNKYDC